MPGSTAVSSWSMLGTTGYRLNVFPIEMPPLRAPPGGPCSFWTAYMPFVSQRLGSSGETKQSE